MTNYPQAMPPVYLEEIPDFSQIENRIFSESQGDIYIGGKKISKEIHDLFREQSKYIAKSDLWEVLNASITNEAINLALVQSKDFDHVRFAKALWHHSTFMRNIILRLSK